MEYSSTGHEGSAEAAGKFGRPPVAAGRDALVIVGASARAAAQSAVRAGVRPIAADLFGDVDLRAVADVLPVHGYPRGLAAAARGIQPAEWMYVGAVENDPDLVAEISAHHRLLGNPPEVLRQVRDPFHVADLLRHVGLPALAVRGIARPPQPDGSWLIKRRRGAGGTGIRPWTTQTSRSNPPTDADYFQRRVAGTAISTLFLAAPGATTTIGTARQFIGLARLGAPPFAFCGAVGPITGSTSLARRIDQIGQVLARTCRLRGLFGCDFVVDGETPWLTEVNPRYTASAELFELAGAGSLIARHIAACRAFDGTTVAPSESLGQPRQVVGKMILFAEQALTVPRLVPVDDGPLGGLADIPAPGTSIARGRPICTVLAAADDAESCARRLWQRVDQVAAQYQHVREAAPQAAR